MGYSAPSDQPPKCDRRDNQTRGIRSRNGVRRVQRAALVAIARSALTGLREGVRLIYNWTRPRAGTGRAVTVSIAERKSWTSFRAYTWRSDGPGKTCHGAIGRR